MTRALPIRRQENQQLFRGLKGTLPGNPSRR